MWRERNASPLPLSCSRVSLLLAVLRLAFRCVEVAACCDEAAAERKRGEIYAVQLKENAARFMPFGTVSAATHDMMHTSHMHALAQS